MKVTFTGAKNINGLGFVSKNSTTSVLKVGFQVNNDGVKDKDKLKEILEEYPDPNGKDFILLEAKSPTKQEISYCRKTLGQILYQKPNIRDDLKYDFAINGKSFDVTLANMGKFEKLGKLMTRLADSKEEFKTNKDSRISFNFIRELFGDIQGAKSCGHDVRMIPESSESYDNAAIRKMLKQMSKRFKTAIGIFLE